MNFIRNPIVMISLSCMIMGCAPSLAKSAQQKSATFVKRVGKVGMVEADLLRCQILSAKLTMVGEDVFTRTAITEATIEKFGQTVTFPAGDPRTAQLSQILNDVVLGVSTLDAFEPRMRLMVNCADGTSRKIMGSRLSPDGALDLNIDGKNFSTVSPLRRKLEEMLPAKK